MQLAFKNTLQRLYLKDAQMFDFSGYAKDNPCFSNENKKVVGKMKDELNEPLAFLRAV